MRRFLRAALIRVITVIGNLLCLLHLRQIVITFRTLLHLGQMLLHLGLLQRIRRAGSN